MSTRCETLFFTTKIFTMFFLTTFPRKISKKHTCQRCGKSCWSRSDLAGRLITRLAAWLDGLWHNAHNNSQLCKWKVICLCRLSSICRRMINFMSTRKVSHFCKMFRDVTVQSQSRQGVLTRLFLQSSELGLPHPLTPWRVCPLPLWFRGGTHSLGREGVGGSQFGRRNWRYGTLGICVLCAVHCWIPIWLCWDKVNNWTWFISIPHPPNLLMNITVYSGEYLLGMLACLVVNIVCICWDNLPIVMNICWK